ASAIVTVDAGQNASLAGLTIANGNAHGISNAGTLSVANSEVWNNAAADFGGGISNTGTLSISGSFRSRTSALAAPFERNRGAIWNDQGTVSISDSIVSDNSAFAGGGIFNFSGTMTVSGSTVSCNSASLAGGFFNRLGTASISDSTLSDNTASANGGGIISS